ncbi:MAG: class II glutamine amidotransferase [Kiritimatiellae bacterium]|nr:class II glutamine amidotransferase [Kiritimatiellia bacterium]MDW8459278.1 class II glutamine amidotransferase [Verrucomicrobiota bacterium]
MCELLGLNFNLPISPSLSFRGFRHRGEENPDGWGIARFEGKACQVVKEPTCATDSGLAKFLRDYENFRSTIFIGHVRHATRGSPALVNTHPFVRTFRKREVVLAHNGHVESVMDPSALKFHPVGETDSEYLFCSLLTKMSVEKIDFEDYEKIEAMLREFNQFGTMNLLMSEGVHLYSYRDAHGYNGLSVTRRVTPFGTVRLMDEDWIVDLDEEKSPDQRGIIIASKPLTVGEKWQDLTPGTLNVFVGGACVYSGA